jgi:DUF1680 family protein
MASTRREFLSGSTYCGLGIAASQMLGPHRLLAELPEYLALLDTGGDRMAIGPASDYRAYVSKPADRDATTWVQVDLGSSRVIQALRLYPAVAPGPGSHRRSYGFPVRFKVEASDDPNFGSVRVITEQTDQDFPDCDDRVTQYSVPGTSARYVRLTATRLSTGRQPADGYRLALGKIGILSDGIDIAVHQPVTADALYGNQQDLMQVTRAPRPMGEGVVTDHPENVTAANSWQPKAYKIEAPRRGVTLDGGVFQTALENNIAYLLNSFSVDEMLRPFWERAGKPVPPGIRYLATSWDAEFSGSCAGRFLMGAGNTLRWQEHAQLRHRMDAVVDGIEQCRLPNGYIMAYPEDTVFYGERGNYTRAWVTHGLIEAGYAGNPKAFELLRGYYDWFNKRPYLNRMLRVATLGYQGIIANTRMYFTPVGKPEDLQVAQRYYQENYWLEGLEKRDERVVWQYPYDRPHCYELTAFEAYLDLYRATGEARYLNAVVGGWELHRDHWEITGGTSALMEYEDIPPGSYYVQRELGELCGNSFWTFLSQRLHLLSPEEERYVAEVEKSIYNVAMAAQSGGDGLRYNAILVGKKQEPTRTDTCCEGQGTRLLGSIPEHIYSIAPDGLYINLFAPSTIEWRQQAKTLRLKMTTEFPFNRDVRLHISVSGPTQSKLRVRIPSWAATEIEIALNGKPVAKGAPGSYALLDHLWSNEDIVSFTLPVKLKLIPYTGLDQIPGHPRFALQYGPILMAAVGPADTILKAPHGEHHDDLLTQLKPKPDQPLHFTIEHNPEMEYMPYWQVEGQSFTCFPGVDLQAKKAQATTDPDGFNE